MKTIKIVPDSLNGQPYEHPYAKERKDKLLQDPKVGIYLYFKYSKNTPWVTTEELANRVKQHINGKN